MTLATFVVVLNLILVSASTVFMFLAAGRGIPEMRPWHAAAGVLAAIYTGAYAVLLAVGTHHSATWSTWVRPFGILAWPVAWIVPALISCRLWRHLNRLGDHHES